MSATGRVSAVLEIDVGKRLSNIRPEKKAVAYGLQLFPNHPLYEEIIRNSSASKIGARTLFTSDQSSFPLLQPGRGTTTSGGFIPWLQ
ncbi:MAG TPA: hypothetical protein DCE56_07720 [Cyanobacteria bacterium UBA8553]|nr:hypothetical protein [Cyanobacteria bacterium UBA8553]